MVAGVGRLVVVVTALYRRYRPDTFADVIGQEHVTVPLMTALRTNRVSHAYLFSGPRGCGKTTSARILARCLNCAEGPTDTPCGKCASCVELSTGGSGSLDVVEIDAASHGGVDDARDLRERAFFAPARDRYKIFIIDEAHMVTPSGFNALLKIVEEPPEHVKFVFATTEPDKVIGTIRSRTHHYPFRLVPPSTMTAYLERILAAEHIEAEPGVLPLIVRAGAGSVRDTLSVADQLIAGTEGGILGYRETVSLLGYTPTELLTRCVDAVSIRDASLLFEAVEAVIESGQDPRRFVEDLLERLRDLLLVSTVGPAAQSVLQSATDDEAAVLAREAQAFGPAQLSRAASVVSAALTDMVGTTSPRIQLEVLCARLLLPESDDTAAGTLSRLDRLERRVGVEATAAPAPVPAPAPAPAPEPEPAPAPVPVTADQMRHSWPQILEELEKANRAAWSMMMSATVVDVKGDVLALSFPSQGFAERFRTGGEVVDAVRHAIISVVGLRVRFLARVSGPDEDTPPEPDPDEDTAHHPKYGEAVVREVLKAVPIDEHDERR